MQNLLDLLRFNGGCSFSCWWGIEPGSTSVDDALSIARKILLGTGEYDGRGPHHYLWSFGLGDAPTPDLAVWLYDEDDLIQRIRVSLWKPARFVDIQDTLQQLSIKSILTRYGQPSEILLNVEPPYEASDVRAYHVWAIYEKLGFTVEYEGITSSRDTLRICSLSTDDIELDYISVYLQSPDSNLDPVNKISSELDKRPLEGNSNVDIDQFTTLFSSEDANPCFITPRDIWQ
jgi:hypothetical protein